MANTRISDLTASASNLAASDLVPVVQTPGVGPVKMTGTQIKTGIIGAGSVSIASGKTFTASNTLTLAGTDSTTMTFPSTSATLARTDAGNTFTGAQTFSVGTVNGTGLDITQTWTGTGTYTGLKYNVGTDSGPANAASLLLDLQVGGTSKMSVAKTGTIAVNGPSFGQVGINLGVNTATYSYIAGAQGGGAGKGLYIYATSANISTSSYDYVLATTGFFIKPTLSIGWASTSDANQTVDLFLTRAAAATLQLGAADAAAPVAQTFKVQGVVAGTSNTAGANFTIQGSQGTGTGAGGSIIFQVAPAGSSGTAQNAYSTALTIAPGGIATATGTSSPAFVANNTTGSSKAAAITAGAGASVFLFDDTGIFGIYSNLKSRIIGTQPNSSATGQMIITTSSRAIVGSGGAFAFDSTSDPANNTPDVFLNRDNSNILALRNGGTSGSPVPQTFRVYNWGDATNGEFGALTWTSDVFQISVSKNGTGTVRDIFIGSGSKGITLSSTGNTIRLAPSGGAGPLFTASAFSFTGWAGGIDYSLFGTTQAGNTNRDGSNVYVYPLGGSGNGIAGQVGLYASLPQTAGTSGHTFELAVRTFLTATGTPGLQFGGTTSSFPALKRSTTTLQVRLADDSAFAPVQGKLTTDTAYTAGDPTTTGYLVIYDSNGTAYKVPALAV